MGNMTLRYLAAAGLLHDLGKFAERAGATADADPDMVRQEYGYGHAHASAQLLQALWGEAVFRRIDGGEAEDNLFNLSVRHHKPRRPLEVILSEADRLASGHERAKADEEAQMDVMSGTQRKARSLSIRSSNGFSSSCRRKRDRR